MKGPMRRLCACVGAAVLAASLPTGVGRADNPSASPASLAASAMFDLLFSRPRAEAAAAKLADQLAAFWPASWTPAAADAVWEEDQAARPALEARFVLIFQAHFTPQELTAGIDVLRAQLPTRPDQPAQLDPAVAAKVEATPEGRSFVQTYNQVAHEFDDAAKSMMGERIPDLFRRVGEKAERMVATAPATEAERLQDQVACELLPPDQARENMKPQLQQGIAGMLSAGPAHSEWRAMLDKAVSDEVDASRTRFCLAIGQWLGRGLTEAESQAALEFLETPSGVAFRGQLTATMLRQPRPAMPPGAEAGIARFMATPAGAKIEANLAPGSKLSGDAGIAYGVSIAPGVFRRFGEAASAHP